MKHASLGAVYLATVIVSGAILALIVSRKSNAAEFIKSTGAGFNALLAKALAP